MSFLPAERETTLQTDDESKKWILHTYQSKIMTKLKKIGVVPIKVFSDGGAQYELDFNQVSFRSKGNRRSMTEEQRKAVAERLAKARSHK